MFQYSGENLKRTCGVSLRWSPSFIDRERGEELSMRCKGVQEQANHPAGVRTRPLGTLPDPPVHSATDKNFAFCHHQVLSFSVLFLLGNRRVMSVE